MIEATLERIAVALEIIAGDRASKVEPAKKEPVKKEPIKEKPVKKEPAKKEPVKKEPVKEEPVKEEPVMDALQVSKEIMRHFTRLGGRAGVDDKRIKEVMIERFGTARATEIATSDFSELLKLVESLEVE